MTIDYCPGCPARRAQEEGPDSVAGAYIGDNLCEAMGGLVPGTKGLTNESINLVLKAEVESMRNKGEVYEADYLVSRPDLVFAAHACWMRIQEGKCQEHQPQPLNYIREIA